MTEMTDSEIAAHEAALIRLRAELEALIDSTEEGARPVDLESPIGRLSRIDAIQTQKMTESNRTRQKVRLQHVMAALAAVRRGEYGACRRCGDPIGEARLRATPEAPLCIDCMEGLEVPR